MLYIKQKIVEGIEVVLQRKVDENRFLDGL